MPLLQITNLVKRFGSPAGPPLTVVDVPAFSLEAGQQLALRGDSGSGKTTFLHLIAGILAPDAGSVQFDGLDISAAPESGRDRLRAAGIGYVFQTFNLLQGFTAIENVELAMMFGHGRDRDRAASLLQRVGLGDRLHHRPAQLSVGQQQRVALARALANHPRLVLADEPTGSLDATQSAEALRLMRELCEANNAALLLVSHDESVLSQFDNRADFSELNRAGRMTDPAPAQATRPIETARRAAPAPHRRTERRAPRATAAAISLIVRRSLRRHAFAATITVLATALAAGLVMSVFAIADQTERAFIGRDVGYDAVLGARGSRLQLVMNSVFHLDASPGNIPWSVYERLRADPRVALAVPYAVGDHYRGFRIVGTTTDQFHLFRYDGGKSLAMSDNGRVFDPARREAVVGSFVAQETGLGYGDTFHPSHGISADEVGDHHDHHEDYVVVGVLEPTNTPIDRVVWIPIEGMFRMSGHVLRGEGRPFVPQPGDTIPGSHKEVSAVMLKFKAPAVGADLDNVINREGREMTLAWPIASILADFFDKFGWVTRVLRLVAYLVVAASAGAILASIYNTINERRREFAILRALGARKRIVFVAIVTESAVIASLGAVAGYVVYAGIVAVASVAIRHQTGVVIEASAFHAALALVPPGMLALGAAAGIIPAIKAYWTDVATHLAPHS